MNNKNTAIFLIIAIIGAGIWMYVNSKKEITFPMEGGARASLPVSGMPADNTLHSTDLFYVIDQGVSSRKMTASTIINYFDALDDIVRGEVADTAAQLRSEIAGGGAFSRSGNYVTLTTIGDSIGLGTSSPTEKLDVNGVLKANYVEAPAVLLSSDGAFQMYMLGDDLMLKDNNNPSGVSVSTLLSSGGGVLSKTGDTYYFPLNADNLHIGESTATTYKLKVTGDFNVTGNNVFNTATFNGITAHYDALTIMGASPLIFAGANGYIQGQSGSLHFADADTSVTLYELATSLGGGSFTGNAIDSLSITESLALTYLAMSASDSLALVAIGAAEDVQGFELVPASQAWIDKLVPFKKHFKEAKKLQALPLPYPDGTQRRQMNAVYQSYQTEYELERANRYINRLWNWLAGLTVVVLLLSVGFVYLFREVRKINSKLYISAEL